VAGQRASIQIGVAQVLRRAGVQHPLQRTVQLDELRVGDAVVEAATPIDLDLVLEATGNAVIASGVVRTVASCQCRRCLERFDQPVDAPVREIFEPRPTEGETYPLTAEHIDVVPLVRDAILLALPLAPLCRADCPGPAPEAFPALSGDARATPRPPSPIRTMPGHRRGVTRGGRRSTSCGSTVEPGRHRRRNGL